MFAVIETVGQICMFWSILWPSSSRSEVVSFIAATTALYKLRGTHFHDDWSWTELPDAVIKEVKKKIQIFPTYVTGCLAFFLQRFPGFCWKQTNHLFFSLLEILAQMKHKHRVLARSGCDSPGNKERWTWADVTFIWILTSLLLSNMGSSMSMVLSRMCRSPLEAMMSPCIIFTFVLPP